MERRRWQWVALAAITVLAAIVAASLLWLGAGRPTFSTVLDAAQRWHASPFAPLVALAAFLIGGFVVFPVNLLIAATIVVLGPIAGGLTAMAGSLLSAAALHEAGHRLPQAAFSRIVGERGERLRARVVGHGVLAVALVRLVPVAPYSIVSLIAGAAGLPRIAYLVGTTLGMFPGIVLYAVFVERASAALRDPNPLAWLGALLALVAIIAVGVFLRMRHAPPNRA
ncbi:MAG: VTT domain-containing protein [Dokdonella sp.]|uniref:TVP38/TMEM64 family protein n=1 Tax=Dokdonella sp. TaxID=2291710 RepID=UPI00326581F2